MGPPRLNPYCFTLNAGVRSGMPTSWTPATGSLLRYVYSAPPWNSLVPLFVTALTSIPAKLPWRTSVGVKLTRNSLTASSEMILPPALPPGTPPVAPRLKRSLWLAPSIVIVLKRL